MTHLQKVKLSLWTALFFLWAISNLLAEPEVSIFIVHSRGPSATRSLELQSALQNTLTEAGITSHVRASSIYHGLDEGLGMEGLVEKILYNDISKCNPDIIVINGSRATEKFATFRNNRLSQWPMIFCAIPKVPEGAREKFPQAVFLLDKFPLEENINLILNLHPDIDRIVFTGSSSKAQNKYRFQDVRNLAPKYRGKVVFEYFFDRPVSEIRDALIQSQSKDALVELKDLIDEKGNTVYPQHFFPEISKRKHIPVYSFWPPHIDHKIVGGYLFDEAQKGAGAGEMILKILNNKTVSHVTEANNSIPTFYWNELKRFSINPENLPKGSIIKEKPMTLSPRQQAYILGLGVFAIIQIVIISLMVRSMRQREKAKEELAQSNATLEERNEELKFLHKRKSEYIATVTHDLKNPIAGINSSTQLIDTIAKEYHLTGEGELLEISGFIKESSDNMLKMIDKLLKGEHQASKMDSSQFSYFSLSKAINETIHSNQIAAKAKRIKLQIESSREDIEVFGDRDSIKIVADNLISNAIKYSYLLSTVEIFFGYENRNQPYWILKVKDQGPGFTEEDQANLFKLYGKLSAKPTGDESSSGIGLFIVKQIVEAHQGTISLESEAGQGSTFMIKCPVNLNEKSPSE